jgi:ADP-heptose:LPS heptosyltransferase
MENFERSMNDTLLSQNATFVSRIAQLEEENLSLRINKKGFEYYFSSESKDIYRQHRSSLYRLQSDIDARKSLGDLQERRDSFLSLATNITNYQGLSRIYPHNGMGNNIRVLLFGSGGIGDCLVLTHCSNVIRNYLPVEYIAVGFESSCVNEVFSGSKIVDDFCELDSESRDLLFAIATTFDIFDLVIDVRYAAIPFFPPLSRVSEITRQVISENSKKWYRYNAFDWPHSNHLFAKKAISLGLNAYSLFSDSIGITDTKTPVLDIEPNLFDGLESITISGKLLVCIGVGSDVKMSTVNGLSTKTLPIDKIIEIVSLLNSRGFHTVQLGAAHEPLVEGVKTDFRGRLTIRQSASVLKLALCYIGPEGGLVHLAKAVNTPSVVYFGSTPLSFFGYSGNVNLSSNSCNGCWWTKREWMIRCINIDAPNICMHSLKEITVIESVEELKENYFRNYEIIYVSENELANFLPKFRGKEKIDLYDDLQDNSGSNNFNIDQAINYLPVNNIPVLSRKNVSYKLSLDYLYVDLNEKFDAVFKMLNAPFLLSSNRVVILGEINEEHVIGISLEKANEFVKSLERVFKCKGWKVNFSKQKKSLNKQFIVLKEYN